MASSSVTTCISRLLGTGLLVMAGMGNVCARRPGRPNSAFVDGVSTGAVLGFRRSSVSMVLPSLLLGFKAGYCIIGKGCPREILSLVSSGVGSCGFSCARVVNSWG